jgi:hypothetical protein
MLCPLDANQSMLGIDLILNHEMGGESHNIDTTTYIMHMFTRTSNTRTTVTELVHGWTVETTEHYRK